ncbi:hypothetical protein [Natronorubrum halophilum]|uniref:hypothetical protein n=1 Tax=Natronorubrum halophilum TaxID=1702106 RepID=UPI0013CED83A|nr:hypothetical protein [Natronorubrum halophilum]
MITLFSDVPFVVPIIISSFVVVHLTVISLFVTIAFVVTSFAIRFVGIRTVPLTLAFPFVLEGPRSRTGVRRYDRSLTVGGGNTVFGILRWPVRDRRRRAKQCEPSVAYLRSDLADMSRGFLPGLVVDIREFGGRDLLDVHEQRAREMVDRFESLADGSGWSSAVGANSSD